METGKGKKGSLQPLIEFLQVERKRAFLSEYRPRALDRMLP
jgi:hypothetical protein